MTRPILRVALATAMTLALVGCSSSSDSDSSGGKPSEITIYSPAAGEYGELIKAFNKDHADIKVNAVRLLGPELETRLQGEVTAKKPVGDLVVTSLTAPGGPWQHADWYSTYIPDNAKTLGEENINTKQGYFISDRSVFGLAYNSKNVKETDVPTSWDDMLEPMWKGKISMSDPRAQALTSTMFIALLDNGIVDDAWFAKLAAQEPVVMETPQIGQSLTSGQTDLALWGSTFVKNAASKGAPLKFSTNVVVASANAAMLLKEAPNPEGSKVFLEWLASEKGQQSLSSIGFYPSLKGVEAPDGLTADMQMPLVPTFDKAAPLTAAVIETWTGLLG